ncbi:MAG: SMP-30/gluconolactonase/LRE family protein [Planctomycetales bacterium]|nr:SMP-30/gluconolactonase/LRE family protein [Planctomycetales bacterium]
MHHTWILPYLLATYLLASALPLAHGGEFEGLGSVGEVKLVRNGFQFLEGPAKTPDGSLYFTDIPNDAIQRLRPDGKIELFLQPAGHANGLMYGGENRLLACQMDGQLAAIDLTTKSVSSLTSEYQGARYNACNDLVIDRTGGIYFTDPRYRAPEPWPQKVEAFYYRQPDGTVLRLGSDLTAPNGIMLSPDEKTLYVVPSMSSRMMAYDIIVPGKIGMGHVFCELQQPSGQTNTGGDGLTVDIKGNVYITSNLGVQVFSPNGKLLGIIECPEQPANASFGGPENKTLYMTSRTGLYSCELPVAGHLFRN